MKRRNGMRPVHPGEILKEEIDELEMSARALAEAINVPFNRVSAILREARLPHPNMLPWSMYLKTAIAVCRVAWLFGYSRNADGIERDRARARHAAKWLAVLAEK